MVKIALVLRDMAIFSVLFGSSIKNRCNGILFHSLLHIENKQIKKMTISLFGRDPNFLHQMSIFGKLIVDGVPKCTRNV